MSNTINITSEVPGRFLVEINGNKKFLVKDADFELVGDTVRFTGTNMVNGKRAQWELRPARDEVSYNGVAGLDAANLQQRLAGKIFGGALSDNYYTKAEIDALLSNLVKIEP